MIQKFDAIEPFNVDCANALINVIRSANNHDNRKVIGLSGGSTPIPIYQRVKQEILSQNLSLEHVTFFLVDDRYISSNHSDSNINLVNTHLLTSEVRQKNSNVNFVHPRVDSLELDQCVADYNAQIVRMIREDSSNGKADFVTLGMGGDGHTASLFPPLVEEAFEKSEDKLVLHTTTEKFAVFNRIGVNINFLENKCDRWAMYLKGKDKLQVWETMEQEVKQAIQSLDTKRAPESIVRRWPCANLLLSPNLTVYYCE